MHEPVVELLPALVAVGTSVGAHLLVRIRAAVPNVGNGEPAQHTDEVQAEGFPVPGGEDKKDDESGSNV